MTMTAFGFVKMLFDLFEHILFKRKLFYMRGL